MKTVSFFGICALSASKVLVSKHIGHPYRVTHISARFAQGCNNLLKLRFYTSIDNDAPVDAEPSGVSMLRDYGQADYVVGNDDTKELDHELEVAESGSFLKVYAENNDTFEHSVDVQMTIEEMERK